MLILTQIEGKIMVSKHQPNIQIVVPCYNPEPNWAEALWQAFEQFVLATKEPDTSLILVNDGSTKEMKAEDIAFLKSKITHFQYITYPENKGKGYALRQGVGQANGKYILLTDIDFPYTTQSMKNLSDMLKQENDIVVGFRSNTYYKKVPLSRKILSKILRWLLDNVLKLPTNDSQCGLKGFSQKGKEIFLKTAINRFLFDLEFLMLAARKKELKIQKVNVELKEGIVFSKMNLKVIVQEGLNFIKIYLKNLTRSDG